MTGIALAAIGLTASVTFATAANATEGVAYFQNWYQCVSTGFSGVFDGHQLTSWACYGNETPDPTGPKAYMEYTY
jgi:hypothetical protein